jgi:hypothetical protein
MHWHAAVIQETVMGHLDEISAELKQLRDEVALRIHLASMEVREEWEDLEGNWDNFKARADLEETAEGLGSAVGKVGQELLEGYRRIARAIKD